MSGPDGVAGDRLRSFVERIERIDEDLKAMNDEKKGVFAEAKSEGFDVKILKEVIRLRKQDQNERDERDTQLDLYLHAIETAPAPKGTDCRVTLNPSGTAGVWAAFSLAVNGYGPAKAASPVDRASLPRCDRDQAHRPRPSSNAGMDFQAGRISPALLMEKGVSASRTAGG
jgi:uncharacterized protein (UPF0335 family)